MSPRVLVGGTRRMGWRASEAKVSGCLPGSRDVNGGFLQGSEREARIVRFWGPEMVGSGEQKTLS